MAERSNPTAVHEVVDGQETPSRPTAEEGTVREVQSCPPSLVVRRSRLVPPLAPMPPPTTAHWVALPHEMAFNMVVPGGTAWLVQDAPPSALDKMTPDGEPSGGVASPTRKQCVAEAHVRPPK